jgi:N-acetylneuraminate synthase
MDINEIKAPYLIGEIGINHNGNLEIAKKLIDAVFSCSWDCVKFQKRNPESCIPEHQKQLIKETPWGKMTYYDYKRRIEFGRSEYDYIDRYCREKPLDWTLSVWDLDSLDFSTQFELPFLKIPSALLTNDKLLMASSKSNIPVLLSTGMSTLEEIDHAVNILEKHARSYALMHCNSSYPARYDELNLNCIPMLRDRYKCAVGYSGHEYGLEPTIMACVLGARIIERHITLDHEMWGTDQSSSIEIHGLHMLYKRLRDVDIILGNGRKSVTPNEIPIREKLRKHS